MKSQDRILDRALDMYKGKEQQLDELEHAHADYIYHDFLDGCYYKLGDMWKSKKIPVCKDTGEYLDNTIIHVNENEQLKLF